MKKMLLLTVLMTITQSLHAAGVSRELNCRHQNLTLTYSGAGPVEPTTPYKLSVDGEDRIYNGVPEETDIASESDTIQLDFKYKGDSEKSTNLISELTSSDGLKIERAYFLNLRFTAMPSNSSEKLKKLLSDNPLLQFTCTETIITP